MTRNFGLSFEKITGAAHRGHNERLPSRAGTQRDSNSSPSSSDARPAVSPAPSQVSAVGSLSRSARQLPPAGQLGADKASFLFKSTLDPQTGVDGGYWLATADPANPVAALSLRDDREFAATCFVAGLAVVPAFFLFALVFFGLALFG